MDAVLEAARAVTPAERFGVIHARIEDDLRAPGIPKAFWESRTPLPRLYDTWRLKVESQEAAECHKS